MKEQGDEAEKAEGELLQDVGPPVECPSCSVCEYECYLSTVECEFENSERCYLCLMHALRPFHDGMQVKALAICIIILLK